MPNRPIEASPTFMVYSGVVQRHLTSGVDFKAKQFDARSSKRRHLSLSVMTSDIGGSLLLLTVARHLKTFVC
jgi:hypothetical protein